MKIAVIVLFIIGTILFWDLPRYDHRLVRVEVTLDSLQADNVKLSQNDSTLAAVINQLYRKIKALEADTVRRKR